MFSKSLYSFFPGSQRGTICIVAEELEDSKYDITMQLSATKLDKKDFFGKVCVNMCIVKVLCNVLYNIDNAHSHCVT